jgi:hypothetical protein
MMLWKNLRLNVFILLRNRSEGNAEPEFLEELLGSVTGMETNRADCSSSLSIV